MFPRISVQNVIKGGPVKMFKHSVPLLLLPFVVSCLQKSWSDVFFLLQNSGQVAPLDEIIRLKEKYLFRVLLDESNSLGVLGNSGRGLTEYCNVPVCFQTFVSLISSSYERINTSFLL